MIGRYSLNTDPEYYGTKDENDYNSFINFNYPSDPFEYAEPANYQNRLDLVEFHDFWDDDDSFIDSEILESIDSLDLEYYQ